MALIQPVNFPIVGTAVELKVLILNFSTSATTCTTYYQLLTAEGKQCIDGNYTLTDEQFADWGYDNTVVDYYVADAIGVTIIKD